jgi:serine/threonine-protein kinase
VRRREGARLRPRADADKEEKLGVSKAEVVLGTPLYMAPESIRAPSTVDARADIYALGAVGYFLVTGKPVFSESSMIAVLSDHLHTKPLAPSKKLGAPVPADLESVLLACLAKSPDERPASALVLRDRLRACADAGGWTEQDASAFWRSRRAAVASKVETVSVSATTIAIDLEQRSPTAISAS